MEKPSQRKFDFKGLKNRFGIRQRPKLVMADKLVKIQNLITSYTHKTSPLQSRKSLIKIPLNLPSRFKQRTKSCDLIKVKLPALKSSSSKTKCNIRYFSKDFDDEENKNCIITPDESWKSTKKFYQDDGIRSKYKFTPISNEDSNRTQDTNPQTTRRSSIKRSKLSLISM